MFDVGDERRSERSVLMVMLRIVRHRLIRMRVVLKKTFDDLELARERRRLTGENQRCNAFDVVVRFFVGIGTER